MSHQDQRHEHHRKEREEHKKEQKEHEKQDAKSALPFHPAWLAVGGIVLVIVAMLIWTFAF